MTSNPRYHWGEYQTRYRRGPSSHKTEHRDPGARRVQSQRRGRHPVAVLLQDVDRPVRAHDGQGLLGFLVLPPARPADGLPGGGDEERSDLTFVKIDLVHAVGEVQVLLTI